MYNIYENGILIQTVDEPMWQAYDERAESFYCVEENEARAILIQIENEEPYYANIEGKEGYSWLTRTVTVQKVNPR